MRRDEDKLQRACVDWLAINRQLGHLSFFAIPNGGARSPTEAAILKGLGVRAGVADIAVLLPGGRTIWTELKAPTGRQSATQADWAEEISALGHRYALIRDLDEMVRIVTEARKS